MPSTSKKQHRLMAAVAHNPSFAKKVGIPQSVGRDFTEADKGRKFAKGGDMAKKLPPFMGKESKAEEAKEMKIKRMSPALYKKGEKAEGVHGKSGMEKPTKYANGGFTRAADGVATKGKTKAQRFAGGGMPTVGMAPPPAIMPVAPAPTAPSRPTPMPNASGMAQPTAQQLMAARAGQTPAQRALGNASKLLAGSQKPMMSSQPVGGTVSPGKPGMGQGTTSGARPTNPFTNPKQYQAEQALQSTARLTGKQQLDRMMADRARLQKSPGYKPRQGGFEGRLTGTDPTRSDFNTALLNDPKFMADYNARMQAPQTGGVAQAISAPGNQQISAAQASAMREANAKAKDLQALGMARPGDIAAANRAMDQFAKEQQKKLAATNSPAPYMNNYGNPGGPVMRGGQQTPVSSGGSQGYYGGNTGFSPSYTSTKVGAGTPKQLALNQMASPTPKKKGGVAKTFAKGGSIDGCATKGKTKGRYI